jgi:glycosyltransferase involved in cell wall biosynthesis
MKILIDHHEAFMLAHGGLQIQIERTAEALRGHGLDVEWLRWWDERQKGDVIHFFGRPNPGQIVFAQGKGIRYVMQELLTSQGSRSKLHLRMQGFANAILRKVLPGNYRLPLRWDSYRMADAIIAITPWEAWIMQTLFRPPVERLHVIPNGVDNVFFGSRDAIHASLPREKFLVSVATITERKRVLELAEAATLAKIPLKVIGKPYAEHDPYYWQFLDVVKSSGGLVDYLGAIEDRSALGKIYRDARGFVLPSTMETQSLAALEAAAVGCPLLLSDLPWARQTFGDEATYLSLSSRSSFASQLKTFYQQAPGLPAPSRPATWSEVAGRLLKLYELFLAKKH